MACDRHCKAIARPVPGKQNLPEAIPPPDVARHRGAAPGIARWQDKCGVGAGVTYDDFSLILLQIALTSNHVRR